MCVNVCLGRHQLACRSLFLVYPAMIGCLHFTFSRARPASTSSPRHFHCTTVHCTSTGVPYTCHDLIKMTNSDARALAPCSLPSLSRILCAELVQSHGSAVDCKLSAGLFASRNSAECAKTSKPASAISRQSVHSTRYYGTLEIANREEQR